MSSLPTNFGLLSDELSEYDRAQVVVLPVPFERTVSYGRGTANGPAALIRASQSMELWDEELRCEPADAGIATLPPFLPEAWDLGAAMAELEAACAEQMAAEKFLLTLGGEHSLTIAPVRAANRFFGGGSSIGPIGVVQFDAHADLREEFEGTPYSHAAVMRRVAEERIPSLPIGIRSLSKPEAEFAREAKIPIVWGSELDALDRDLGRPDSRFDALLAALPEQVYLTFDIDYFDPSLVPATGTPEPGGGLWYPTLRLLKRLFEVKTVVAMDVVELAPVGGHPSSDFVAAKLAYKCLGYRATGRKQRGSRATPMR